MLKSAAVTLVQTRDVTRWRQCEMFLSFYGLRGISNEILGLRVMKFRKGDRTQTGLFGAWGGQ